MCGIAGIIGLNKKIDQQHIDTVSEMNMALHHRGPDGDGFYHDSQCALAMRRLSIIDLNGGWQPIYNETKSILVFMNGEIYNFPELKTDLMAKGHQFSTHSDTEVLVHLYEEYREDMFTHVKGMFACCLYDKSDNVFLLGRDRFGEKPLFYHSDGHHLTFSSEIASLLVNENIPRVLNKQALKYYFRTSLVPTPITLFKGVKSIPPGHFIKIKAGSAQVRRYFEVSYKVDDRIKTLSDAVDLIGPCLRKAVERQKISDVPIGAFLSGGIDSSTMVAILAQTQDKPLKTFNARFPTPGYDESKIAAQVAKHYQTDHHELILEDAAFSEDIFWHIIKHTGEPFRDSSAIPTYEISKAIRKHVKVAISGDGGDELFGGYSLFQWYERINKLKGIPSMVRKFAVNATKAIPDVSSFGINSMVRQVNRAMETSLLDKDEIPIALNEMFREDELHQLINDVAKYLDDKESLSSLKTYPEASDDWTPLRKIMYYRMNHTLTNNMLVKVDRMSMSASLETRAPFLDADLFEASTMLPDQFLIHQGIGKYVIRETMKGQLPNEVFNHPKQGFNLPLFKYRNASYSALARKLLFEENPLPGLFSEKALKRIYDRGINTVQDHKEISVFKAAHQLWMVMQFLGWAKMFRVNEE